MFLCAQSGINEVYHWHDEDALGQHTLLYAWTCLIALAEIGVGGQAAVLNTTMPFEMDAAKAHTATSVVALSVQANATTRLIFVAAFNPTTYNSTDEHLNVTFELSAPSTWHTAAPTFQQYRIDANTALYDRMWRELAATGGLGRQDGRTYKLKDMANNKGQQHLASKAAVFMQAQSLLLKPQPFNGQVSIQDLDHDGQPTIQLTTTLPTPSVLVIRVDSS